ncbi:hypothetical protein [Myroides odoratimimus]|uniref:hypothetical protein n=1 Tax=Myroides odoratimimus TaxID=76832 RepID=UPI001CE04D88|nr:hypothetical protein [Myroides odoratimimus]MCA4793922.1 hypothetical protein [Myroides odoratimimus]MCA4821178.1 hypothetical protein [Myroides odoratimimus]MDM1504215.1 hypothetical protein [Myroides odoratimimus]
MRTIERIYTEFLEKKHIKPQEDFYIKSYSYYVYFFAHKEQLAIEDIILGIGLVYSWMPTIPKNIKFEFLDEALPILNRAKKGVNVSREEYVILKALCNNSLVGASKLLHFINPESFAIWDSKIYIYLYQERAHKYKVEDIDKYIAYLDLLNQIARSNEFEPIIKNIQYLFDYEISKYRVIEWVMFNYNSFKN